MIGKQVIGTSFRSVLNYNEEKVKKGVAEIIGSNMLGTDSRFLAKEFGMIRALKPNVSKAVYHTSLSISPDENLSNEQFRELGEKYLDKMGFGNCQFVIYRHTDTEHPHIHLVVNRISMTGNTISDRNNFYRSEKVVRKLEKEFGLKSVQSSKEKALSKGEYEFNKRTGIAPVKVKLQEMVKEALKFSADQEHFQNIMNQMGANVQYHKTKSGQTFGISFELDGISFKGSKLGKVYSWNKIKTQLNSGKDKTTSQTTINGESRVVGSTGRALAEHQQEKYTRANRGSSTDYGQPKWDPTFDKTGGVRNSESAEKLKPFDSESGISNRKNDRSQPGGSKSENILENESLSPRTASGSDNWDDNFSLFVSELNNKCLENNYEESELDKKKKRKKKKLDLSQGMSM
ncbi:MAG: relaxase/mobilization nuclease domain-containing protein [Labilibaculum sp.]|nr:relaxase/mobilization nuclease domain-containing protein [Labilibaculum sp.]MBI9056964.1 relaxase/mobilization nuclease domain-containing protein [Labilibaculum sp.]